MSSLEAGYAMRYGTPVDLSEQQLVDCALEWYGQIDDGCEGGWMPTAFDWLAENGGAVEEYLYPYYAVFGTCKRSNPAKVKVSGWVQINATPDDIKAAIMKYGSLAIAVDANDWGYYGKGVFKADYVGNVNHAVNLVGWGTDPTYGDYWLVRNSWGPNWGENGYIRLSTSPEGTYDTSCTFAVQLA